MSDFQDMRRKFSNNRQWHEFVAAVHESVTYPVAVTYPKVISALRSGRDWCNDGAVRASSWLRGSEHDSDALNLKQIKA
jgi:hypothetical protein